MIKNSRIYYQCDKKAIYHNPSVILLPQNLKFLVTRLIIYISLLRNLSITHFIHVLGTCPVDWWLVYICAKIMVEANCRYKSQ